MQAAFALVQALESKRAPVMENSEYGLASHFRPDGLPPPLTVSYIYEIITISYVAKLWLLGKHSQE